MAKLYVHGVVVAEFAKDGFTTYRLMSDGKWLKSRSSAGWKLAKWKEGVNPFAVLVAQEFHVKVHDRDRMDELLKEATDKDHKRAGA